MKLCEGCGRSIADQVQRGPLTVQRNPSAAYWRGLMIPRLTETEISMLRMLVRDGETANEALEMCHGGESLSMAKVMILRLRRKLAAVTDEVVIHNRYGWGYWIEIEGKRAAFAGGSLVS